VQKYKNQNRLCVCPDIFTNDYLFVNQAFVNISTKSDFGMGEEDGGFANQ
jgi:hypothetical protein